MDAYIGEIRTFSFGMIPRGWAACNGQTMAINQNQALFSLLGTQFGGNGQTTFNLPNLQGKTMLGAGSANGLNTVVGTTGGSTTVTLTQQQLPAHNHIMQVIDVLGTANIQNTVNYLAQLSIETTTTPHTPFAANGYNSQPSSLVALGPDSISKAGGGQAHENQMPYLALNVCICLSGYFPSRN